MRIFEGESKVRILWRAIGLLLPGSLLIPHQNEARRAMVSLRLMVICLRSNGSRRIRRAKRHIMSIHFDAAPNSSMERSSHQWLSTNQTRQTPHHVDTFRRRSYLDRVGPMADAGSPQEPACGGE